MSGFELELLRLHAARCAINEQHTSPQSLLALARSGSKLSLNSTENTHKITNFFTHFVIHITEKKKKSLFFSFLLFGISCTMYSLLVIEMFSDGMFSDGKYGDGMFSDGMYGDGMFSDGMFSDGTVCMERGCLVMGCLVMESIVMGCLVMVCMERGCLLMGCLVMGC